MMFNFFKNRLHHLKDLTSSFRGLIKEQLWLKVLVGMFLGVGIGILLGPTAGIALVLGVDRIIDMCRTALNVTWDLVACTVMDKLTQPDSLLQKLHLKS